MRRRVSVCCARVLGVLVVVVGLSVPSLAEGPSCKRCSWCGINYHCCDLNPPNWGWTKCESTSESCTESGDYCVYPD